METKFHPTAKKTRVLKLFLIIGIIFMFTSMVVVILELPRGTMSSFQLYCLLPSIFILYLLSIADNFYYINYERLVLIPDRITYKSFGLSIEVPWDQIKGIKNDPAFGRRNIECLYFYGKYAKTNLLWLFRMQRQNLIPLTIFADNWRDSELGRQIKQYAPHLFERENIARVNL